MWVEALGHKGALPGMGHRPNEFGRYGAEQVRQLRGIFVNMGRYFNTTGVCYPDKHYMVDPLRGFYDDMRRLIDAE